MRYLNREYGEAVRLCRTALAVDERFWLAHWTLSWALMSERQNELALEHARAALAEEASSGWTRAVYAVASAVCGESEPAWAMASEADSHAQAGDSGWAALVVAATGDVDRAFRFAARAVQERDAMIPAILRHGAFDRHRSDSRYAAISGRLRLNLARSV
jgi:hypothetical protein